MFIDVFVIMFYRLVTSMNNISFSFQSYLLVTDSPRDAASVLVSK